ncbi:unnamed protein product [Prunus armeniaca]|uniref:Uncharacterized protein n=1 Tax=Prunus armeniaca TaxID=36596 RepID=A0A6J5WHU0_PRUAR|nr:unnamed protein product [Prunus armeniaca]
MRRRRFFHIIAGLTAALRRKGVKEGNKRTSTRSRSSSPSKCPVFKQPTRNFMLHCTFNLYKLRRHDKQHHLEGSPLV